MTASLFNSPTKICWDCTVQRPESEMTKGIDCDLVVWRCGCRKGEPPFMTAVAGHVMIHHPITAATLPDAWTGLCVSADNNKAFWNIGQDNRERSYTKLPASVTTMKEALAHVETASRLAQQKCDKTAALWKSLLNEKAVICEMPPKNLNGGLILMNAPRPLLGDQVCSDGPFLHGRFYAAIDPAVEFADQLVARNLRDDARVVFVASKELQYEMAFQLIPLEYQSRYRAKDDVQRELLISNFVNKLQHDKTLVELREMARVANIRLKENALIKIATAPATV